MYYRTIIVWVFLVGFTLCSFASRSWGEEMKAEVNMGDSTGTSTPSPAPTGETGGGLNSDDLVPRIPISREEVPLRPELRLNMNDCIQMAVLNNKEIKSTVYDVEAAEFKLKEAQVRGIPTFEYQFISAPAPRDVEDAVGSFFSGNITYLQRGKIGLGMPLYAFGKLTIAQNLAKSGIEAEKQKKIEKENDIVLKVKKLYHGILLGNDVRELLRDAINHLENEIRRRSEAEEPSDPVKLARLKLYRFEVLSRLAEVEKRSFLAYEGLRIQMGMNRRAFFELVDKHLTPVEYDLKDFESYLETSQKYRPKSNLLKIALRAKEDLYRLEKRKAAPDIGFGGFFEFGATTNSIQGLQLTDDFNDPFNFSRVGFGLRIQGKINPKTYHSKVRQARAEYYKTAWGKKAADEGLELDLKEAYLHVLQNNKNLLNSRKAMKTARQYVFLTKTNVDIGVGDEDDYSDALQQYLVSRGRYLEAVFSYNVAVATLEDKMGGLAAKNAEENFNGSDNGTNDRTNDGANGGTNNEANNEANNETN